MNLLKSITNRILIESHRGAEGLAPENSWPGLEAGGQSGADFLEIDVQLSQDGVAFLRHNYSLPDGRFCASVPWSELKEITVEGEHFPLLEDVLAWVRQKDFCLTLDLKGGFLPEGTLTREVLRIIEHTQTAEQIMLISWDHYELLSIKQIQPKLMTRALLHGRLLDYPGYLRQAQVDAVSLAYGLVRPADVESIHRTGVAIILSEMWRPDFRAVLDLDLDMVSWGDPLEARRALGYS